MIDYWKKYSRRPYDYKNPEHNAIYMILFFTNRRTIFLRKDMTLIGTFETRKTKQLLEAAVECGWIELCMSDCGLGERPTGYPIKADSAIWISINRP